MPRYDSKWGELLNSREVSEMTGHSMNQMRYFKQQPMKAPFTMVQVGDQIYFRKADIEIYLEDNGKVESKLIVPPGVRFAPPQDEISRENREHLTAMAKIVTSNAWSKWTERLTQNGPLSVSDGMKFLRTETVRLLKLGTGDDLEELYPGETYDFWLRTNDPVRFWKGRTWATRSLARQIYGWNVTDEDIINVPIGEVPPSKVE